MQLRVRVLQQQQSSNSHHRPIPFVRHYPYRHHHRYQPRQVLQVRQT